MNDQCPTCDKPVVAVPLGRPRRYCSEACRRAMARLHRDLAQIERELANARHMAATHYSPEWRARYQREVDFLEHRAVALRERVAVSND